MLDGSRILNVRAFRRRPQGHDVGSGANVVVGGVDVVVSGG